jgi:DegV family protein with EDD domain
LPVRIRIVTDSTANLPPDLVAGHRITVVPLQLIVGDDSYAEGVDLTPEVLASALKRSSGVSTSMPSPRAFLESYEELAASGADEIVSIHLSAELSGTHDAALMAARHAPVPVRVVDSTTMGMALGYAVLTAAEAAAAGEPAATVERLCLERATSSTVLFYVNSLEHLRRGGRIGAASAFLGSAFAIKPLLTLTGGHIEPVDRLRTSSKALARLQELVFAAVEEATAAEAAPVDVAVHFLPGHDRSVRAAESLAEALGQRYADQLAGGGALLVELGAIAAAHLGPGTIAAVVTPATEPSAGSSAGLSEGLPGQTDP